MTETTPQQDLTDNEANAADTETASADTGAAPNQAAATAVESDDGVHGFEPGALPASTSSTSSAGSSLSALNDVQMVVTAELGRTTMPMRELLGLTPGVVVEIDRAAGSPIDLLVNGRRIASGEVVVIDEEFGIRITDIIASNSSESRG
ncbi:MAG TPA: flagellar motor switch protein FliN [Ilumatobacteraceae bacterium]|nr:flagellar motor switch protein FliN [Ilumatobacteraceae bacterium]